MTVAFHGGEPIEAHRIYIDPFLDLAVLAIPSQSMPASATQARLDCSSLPRAGAPVVAYGHPGGYRFSGTKGIISGVSSRSASELLQTDVPLNPGNSGGPLINLSSGEIAGINTASALHLQNTNFALSARYACPIVELLRTGKDPSPPRADWRFFTEDEESHKVKVASPGQFGESLGLQAGDEIVSVNGSKKPTNETQVLHALRGHLDQIRIDVARRGKIIHLQGRAESEPGDLDKTGLLVDGMLVSELDKRVTREIDFHGVLVDFVDKGSAAEAAEISASTILVSVNGQATPNLAAARAAFEAVIGKKEPAELVFKNIAGNLKASGLFGWVERRLAISKVQFIQVRMTSL